MSGSGEVNNWNCDSNFPCFARGESESMVPRDSVTLEYDDKMLSVYIAFYCSNGRK